MFDDFTDEDRDVSLLLMSQIGQFVRNQIVSWDQELVTKIKLESNRKTSVTLDSSQAPVK